MGKGTSTAALTSQPVTPVTRQQGSFNDFYEKMPEEFFGNQQINDPTKILDAYMQSMPRFLATQQPVEAAPPVKLNTPASQRFNQLLNVLTSDQKPLTPLYNYGQNKSIK